MIARSPTTPPRRPILTPRTTPHERHTRRLPQLILVTALALTSVGLVGVHRASATTGCHAWPADYAKREDAHRRGTGSPHAGAPRPGSAQLWLSTASAACGQRVSVHLAATGPVRLRLWRLGWYHGRDARLFKRWTAEPSVLIPTSQPTSPPATTAPATPADTATSTPGDTPTSPPGGTASPTSSESVAATPTDTATSSPTGSLVPSDPAYPPTAGPTQTGSDLPPLTTPPGPLGSAAGAPPPADSLPTLVSASAAAWPVATTFTVTPSMPPGIYLLTAAASNGSTTGAPLIVRDDLGPHAITVEEPTLTWQAYNDWGLADLYAYPKPDGGPGGAGEADVVTFDRPYAGLWGVDEDRGLRRLLESRSMDVNWIASQDLERPHRMLWRTKVIVMTRHDEYWTPAMRATVDRAIHRGTNLLNLGGNSMYQDGRFLDATLRWYQVRKRHNEQHAGDAAYEVSNRFVDPPANDPQARLLGENFNCINRWTSYRVTSPRFWAWAGQNIRRGTDFPRLIGTETDGPDHGYPAGTVFPSMSPVYCTLAHVHLLAATSYRVAQQSKAGILDIGSLNWLCNLVTGPCAGYPPTTAAGRRFVTRTTLTLLRAAAKGPLGRRFPARGGHPPLAPPAYPRTVT